MKTRHRGWSSLALVVTMSLATVSGQAPPGAAAASLAGTTWHLVEFQGGDGAVLRPADGSRYELAFGRDGALSVRLDCNRGRGVWKSSGGNGLALGPLVLTRAFCPPPSLHDQILKQWGNIRSYVVKDGHLFLALMADGGIYEFQPAAPPASALKSPVEFRGPGVWACTEPAGGTSRLRVTFYKTEPALVVLERDGDVRVAFQTKAASGARYEGDGVLFWETRGEATLNWSGAESICKR
jgi:heat shock protein HslJ